MKNALVFLLAIALLLPLHAQLPVIPLSKLSYSLYPEINDEKPDLPSPFKGDNGEEYIVAVTIENKFAILPVTLRADRGICPKQLFMDAETFPLYALTGLHYEPVLDSIRWIAGRSIEEITRLGHPGGLSTDGFLAEDEDIISVLKGDNLLVKSMDLIHPQLAKPLFHVLNMMDEDLVLNRWNMAKHRWDHIQYFFYNDQQVFVEAFDTKGGQRSIFDDGIQGAFYVKIWRELTDSEAAFLEARYSFLSPEAFDQMKARLSLINTGEMEPQYIMRYGFYEGHTFWRTDPIAIAFIFGMKSLEELNAIFEGQLDQKLLHHFPADAQQ